MSSRNLPLAFVVAGVLFAASAAQAVPVPPIPVIDLCRCSATVFERTAGGGLTTRFETTDVTDVFTATGVPPRDTCAARSRIDIEWHSEHATVAYRYKLDEPRVVEVKPGVRSVSYLGETLLPQVKVFFLGAAGPQSGFTDSTRRFQLNYAPDTWWSGPDLASPSLTMKPNGEKYALLVGGQLPAPILGSLLSPDSTQVLPAFRPERRTFFEVWKDTIYARQEGDTVHMNSWIILHNGGFDRDSEYRVRVSELGTQLPGFPGGPVLEPGLANGSPIGFRSLVTMSLTPNGLPSRTALTAVYPVFDPNDVFHNPRIAGYDVAFRAGRAFAIVQAEDGDGHRDRRVQDARDLVLRIEAGTATPAEQALRDKVLTFYVDRAPYFITGSPLFVPRASPPETFSSSQWALRLVANDDDPWRPSTPPTPPGGPSALTVLRRRITVHGKDLQGNDFSYVDPAMYVNQQDIIVTVPANLAPGPCTIEVELCDCTQCEDFPGSGRCVTAQFPVVYAPSSSEESSGAPSVAASATAGGRAGTSTALMTPYPNPTNRGITVRFSLAEAGRAEVEIFGATGQRVRRLTSGRFASGEHTLAWDGEDESGHLVAAGVYVVRLRAAGLTMTRKVLVAP